MLDLVGIDLLLPSSARPTAKGLLLVISRIANPETVKASHQRINRIVLHRIAKGWLPATNRTALLLCATNNLSMFGSNPEGVKVV